MVCEIKGFAEYIKKNMEIIFVLLSPVIVNVNCQLDTTLNHLEESQYGITHVGLACGHVVGGLS